MRGRAFLSQGMSLKREHISKLVMVHKFRLGVTCGCLFCPQNTSFHLKKNLPNNAKVCALIAEEGPRWIEERIVQEFLPHETKIILGIPLSVNRVPDTLIWAGTKSGRYTTKSAYKMLSSSRESTTLGPSSPSAQNSC